MLCKKNLLLFFLASDSSGLLLLLSQGPRFVHEHHEIDSLKTKLEQTA